MLTEMRLLKLTQPVFRGKEGEGRGQIEHLLCAQLSISPTTIMRTFDFILTTTQ